MGLFHRDKKNNDDEPDSVQTNSFSDIMNGLQYAVNCAQDTLQNHQIQNLTRLFEGTNANNANTFQSKKIMVGDKTIDIPLIALISHHYLAMDNVQIKFKAKVGSVESQIPENNLLLSSPHRANLQMQMSNIKPDADDVMEVCVNFKVQKIMGAVLQAQEGVVTKEHLELAVTKLTSPVSFALRNDAEDKERILRALKQTNGNRSAAAELLGISRTTLYGKLEEYGLKYKFRQP